MGNIGDIITQPIPPVSTSGTGYATGINAFLEEVKGRLEADFPLSALNPAGGLDMEGNPLINTQYVALEDQADLPSGSPSSRFESYLGDAYWIGPAGAVRITNAGTLDVTASGGIGEDYGSSAAGVLYNNASGLYKFYSNATTLTWGFGRFQGVEIANSATGLFRARLLWAGSADKSYTFPPAPPAAVGVMTMGTGGVMTAGSATVGTTMTIGAAWTFTANPVLSSATRIKHGDRKLLLDSGSFTEVNPNTCEIDGNFLATTTATNASIFYFIPLEVGKRLKSVTASVGKTTTGTTALTFHLQSSGATASTTTGNTTTVGAQTLVATLTTPYVQIASSIMVVKVLMPGFGDQIFAIHCTYDEV